jgi:hypothetical protein
MDEFINPKKEKRLRKEKQKINCTCPCGNPIFIKRQKYCSPACYHEVAKSSMPKVPELLQAFKQLKSFAEVGKFFNVSEKTVRKWVGSYGMQDMINT